MPRFLSSDCDESRPPSPFGVREPPCGWHMFRHTFATLLKANGEDVKTVQELLRHANSRITLEVYTQAVTSHKRAAQSKVVRMIVPNLGANEDEMHPEIGD